MTALGSLLRILSSRRSVSQALPGRLKAIVYPTDLNVLLAGVLQLFLGLALRVVPQHALDSGGE
jgi:hypothetical protein